MRDHKCSFLSKTTESCKKAQENSLEIRLQKTKEYPWRGCKKNKENSFEKKPWKMRLSSLIMRPKIAPPCLISDRGLEGW